MKIKSFNFAITGNVFHTTKLSLDNILLLAYIDKATQSKSTNKNENGFVWLSHTKVAQDLNTTVLVVKKMISTLYTNGYLEHERVPNSNLKGSKAYYALSEKAREILASVDVEIEDENVTENNRKQLIEELMDDESAKLFEQFTRNILGKTTSVYSIKNEKYFSTKVNKFIDDLNTLDVKDKQDLLNTAIKRNWKTLNIDGYKAGLATIKNLQRKHKNK